MVGAGACFAAQYLEKLCSTPDCAAPTPPTLASLYSFFLGEQSPSCPSPSPPASLPTTPPLSPAPAAPPRPGDWPAIVPEPIPRKAAVEGGQRRGVARHHVVEEDRARLREQLDSWDSLGDRREGDACAQEDQHNADAEQAGRSFPAASAAPPCAAKPKRTRTMQQPQDAVELFRDYAMKESLGEGRFGAVWKCVEAQTGRAMACKRVEKGSSPLGVQKEVNCFRRAQGHGNVLRLEQLYESKNCIYFLTELCEGGDLFDYICCRGALPEPEARHMFAQLTSAVLHCHSQGVLHRDIKPENILLTSPAGTRQAVIKLADFGLATRLRDGERAVGWVGSHPYEAPEVLASKPYSFAADIWSMGVVLYGMLSGTWPAFANGRVFDAELDFSWPAWHTISDDAKELVAAMLTPQPHMRPTAWEILDCPWLHAGPATPVFGCASIAARVSALPVRKSKATSGQAQGTAAGPERAAEACQGATCGTVEDAIGNEVQAQVGTERKDLAAGDEASAADNNAAIGSVTGNKGSSPACLRQEPKAQSDGASAPNSLPRTAQFTAAWQPLLVSRTLDQPEAATSAAGKASVGLGQDHNAGWDMYGLAEQVKEMLSPCKNEGGSEDCGSIDVCSGRDKASQTHPLQHSTNAVSDMAWLCGDLKALKVNPQ